MHDLPVDVVGVQRDSDGCTSRAAPPSSSRASSPARRRSAGSSAHYQDPTLPNIDGRDLDCVADLGRQRADHRKLTATTRADESTVVGVSGVFTREVALQVDHAFRRWLIAHASSATATTTTSARRATTTAIRRRPRSSTSSPASCSSSPSIATNGCALGLRQQLQRRMYPVRAAAAAVRGRAGVVLVAQTRDQAICSGAAKPPYGECPAGRAKLPSLRRRGLGRGYQQCRVRSRRDLQVTTSQYQPEPFCMMRA